MENVLLMSLSWVILHFTALVLLKKSKGKKTVVPFPHNIDSKLNGVNTVWNGKELREQ